MTKFNSLPEPVIFPKRQKIAGENIASDYFTGTA
jgi:hypothetical protein